MGKKPHKELEEAPASVVISEAEKYQDIKECCETEDAHENQTKPSDGEEVREVMAAVAVAKAKELQDKQAIERKEKEEPDAAAAEVTRLEIELPSADLETTKDEATKKECFVE